MRDEFAESTELLAETRGDRAMRGVQWSWDPDPDDDRMQVEFAFVLRHGTHVEVIHDTHVEGLFARATWQSLLTEVGFVTAEFARPLGDGAFDRAFVCKRP